MAAKNAPVVVLEELPRKRFGEYLSIFEEAKRTGTLGTVLPPKSIKQMELWAKHGTVFFLIRNNSDFNHPKTGQKIHANELVGACGISKSLFRKNVAIIINQFIISEYRGANFAKPMLRAQEAYAKSKGAKKGIAFLQYRDKAQKTRYREEGWGWGHAPSIGHAFKGRYSRKVRKRL